MDGLLIIDKPQGLTSHDVVARVRRTTQTRQIGHAGTLDPMATGVLVLCVGKATRLSEYLLGEDKAYTGLIKLGQRTNTDDAEGEVIETRLVPEILPQQLEAVRQKFVGEIAQVPPQFSAIKRAGQRAYALARKGENVALAARPVHIYTLRVEQTAPDQLEIFVECGSGTYIRALARDIGAALGCGGHLVALRRMRIGTLSLDDALPLAQIDQWQQHLLPMDRAVSHFAAVALDEQQAQDFGMGRYVDVSDHTNSGICRVYAAQRDLIGMGEIKDGLLKPTKVFNAQ
jgi:tRNA pseudouridine55 synthase